jgi:serine phosphatase RsbU (regulator of sigma subunit)
MVRPSGHEGSEDIGVQPSGQDAGLAPANGDPREHIARLTQVLDITRELAAERDLDQLLTLIINRARVAAGCERASLFLYDEERHELYTTHLTPLEIDEIRLPADQGIVGLVARSKDLVHVADPYRHPLFRPEFDQRTGFRTRNILGAPLRSWTDQKLLGVLYLLNKTDGSFTTADGQLLGAFAAHAALALERALLARHYEEKVKLLTALKVAHEIQASFFPRQLPAVPGYEIAASSRSAEATGGDYYDVLGLTPDRVGLVVADVCGHGLGPSLLMASLRAVLRGLAPRAPSPEALLTDLNEAMYDDLVPRHRFITIVYGHLLPALHRFYYANGGHGPVVLHVQAAAGRVHSLVDDEARGCPLGLLKEPYAACTPVDLAPGDLLVLGSDGLVETRQTGQCFGMERLTEFLLENRARPLPQVVEELFAATTAFHERQQPDDDLTLLLVRRVCP